MIDIKYVIEKMEEGKPSGYYYKHLYMWTNIIKEAMMFDSPEHARELAPNACEEGRILMASSRTFTS